MEFIVGVGGKVICKFELDRIRPYAGYIAD